MSAQTPTDTVSVGRGSAAVPPAWPEWTTPHWVGAVSVCDVTRATRTERFLERLCQRSFLRMWAHRSPYRLQKDNKRASQGKELCDLIAVFENDVFLFSDKEIEWKDRTEIGVAWRGWYKRAIAASVKQLAGAERWLRMHPDRVYSNKECTTPLPVALPSAATARFHRIAVAHGSSDACRRLFGGGSGSLMLNSMSDSQLPFTVGREGPREGFVHVLDEVTLALILTSLDTLPEFRDYLVAKERLVREGTDILATGEEDLLAIYLKGEDPKQPNKHGFGDTEGVNVLVVTEGEWTDFESSPEKAARDVANADSYMWDRLIDRFATHSMEGTQQFTSNTSPQQTERALRILNAVPRTGRRALAQACYERISTMGDRPYRVWGGRSPVDSEPAFTFLAVRSEEGEDYEEYRKRRLYMLTMCTALSRIRCPQVQTHVGIGQGPIDNDNSEDVVLIDELAWSKELEAEAISFQEEFGILRQVRETRGSTHEYPPPKPTCAPKGSERNQPCPCGSGRKWKRCCVPKG